MTHSTKTVFFSDFIYLVELVKESLKSSQKLLLADELAGVCLMIAQWEYILI